MRLSKRISVNKKTIKLPNKSTIEYEHRFMRLEHVACVPHLMRSVRKLLMISSVWLRNKFDNFLI